MKTFLMSLRLKKGFTLIEIVVTILVASLLGITFIQLMGTGMMGSAEPLLRVQNNLEIQGVMEKITADSKTTDLLSTLKTHVEDGNNVDNDPYFGSYTVMYNDYVVFNESDNEEEEEDIIYVEGNDDGAGGYSILKVTIADVNGEQRLTALFTE